MEKNVVLVKSLLAMMQKKFSAVIIRSCFGHEFGAALVAAAHGVEILIVPNKDNKEEYEAEAQKIKTFMSYACDCTIVPFEERETVEGRDFVKELVSGQVSDSEWEMIFSTQLEPGLQYNEPSFDFSHGILVVPQKLKTDGLCGVSAAQQSVKPSVLNFLRTTLKGGEREVGYGGPLVLGQHFSKTADLETVKALAEDFDMYVPGLTENSEVLGLRGVEHRLYHHMYSHISGSVGIAGTHTWLMLALFPEIPQVILFNKNGVEHWDAIARAARKNGRKVVAIGFDETTDMNKLSERVRRACKAYDIIK